MKIPNSFISVNDVELNMPNNKRREIVDQDGKIIPKQYNYVIQWIQPLSTQRDVDMVILNNTPASFRRNTRQSSTPSPLLLDYHYGAAAIAHWGKKVNKLGPPTWIPGPEVPAPLGPTPKLRTGHQLDLGKRRQREDDRGEGPSSHGCHLSDASEHESGPSTPQQQDKPGYATRGFTVEEAEELVFKIWISTPEAQAEYKREESDKKYKIDKWRKDVS